MDIAQLLSSLPYRKFQNEVEEILLIPLPSQGSGTHELAGLVPGVYLPHIHDKTTSKITFLSGRGVYIVGDDEVRYEAGTEVTVPAGVPHGFEVEESTWLYTIQDQPIMDANGNADFRYEE